MWNQPFITRQLEEDSSKRDLEIQRELVIQRELESEKIPDTKSNIETQRDGENRHNKKQ